MTLEECAPTPFENKSPRRNSMSIPSKRTFQTSLAIIIMTYFTTMGAALSQDYSGKARATNLARNTAITLNGGIAKYVPDKCMFDSSTPLGLCWISKDQRGYLFQFIGGLPGWQVTGMRPTTQTSILISEDGRSVVSINYNTPF